ncbi:MAG: hypothetical protein R2857_04615 [Vampirovibrionales bacterium]
MYTRPQLLIDADDGMFMGPRWAADEEEQFYQQPSLSPAHRKMFIDGFAQELIDQLPIAFAASAVDGANCKTGLTSALVSRRPNIRFGLP